MDETHAQQLIVGCMTASAAIALAGAIQDGTDPGIKMLVGFTAAAGTLAVVSMFQPDIAGSFSILILTTSLFVYGQPFLDLITNITGTDPAS